MNETNRGMQVILHASAFFAPYFVPILIFLIAQFITYDDILKRQAIQALLFQLFITLSLFIASILIWVLIGFLLFPIIFIMWLYVPIKGIIYAINGNNYFYPVVKHFI